MRRSVQLLGILLILTTLVSIGSAAIQVGNVSVTPTGNLVSGVTRASASFSVIFSSSGGYTFDSTHLLQMDTELEQATWTYSTVLDGIENPSKTESGPNIRISGWELSYPSSRTVSLKVKLDGTAPTVTTSEEKIILRVRETDSRSVQVGTEVVRNKLVINPTTLGDTIRSESARLSTIRAALDQLAGSGLDLAAAEGKYGQAAAHIQTSEQSTDFTRKQNDLSAATKLIDELSEMVAEMQARHAITTAERSIDQTDQIITYLRNEKNRGSDPQLISIITRWEMARERLTSARDLYGEGKYEEAVSRATDAATRGDEILNDAVALKEKADSNPVANILGGISGGISGALRTILIILGIAILIVAGIIVIRRRRRWDELG